MDVKQFIRRTLKTGMTAIDVGANVGEMTCEMSDRVGGSGHVFAVEPHPDFFDALVGESMGYTNVYPMKIGLGASTSWRHVKQCKSDNAGVTNDSGPGCYSAIVLRMDDVFGNLPQCHFIKIDCEGMDLDVMAGGLQFIARTRPTIVFETEEAFQYGRLVWASIQEVLGRIGYGLFTYINDGLEPADIRNLDNNTVAMPVK